jgi:membrane protein DedA with SNARE-associated domain
LRLPSIHRGDRFKASLVAFALIAALFLSPGAVVFDRLTSGLGENAGWAWVVLANVLFWAAYFVFRAWRRRRERADVLLSARAPD